MFALPVVRRPSAGVATLLGGGYHASGAGRAGTAFPRPTCRAACASTRCEGAGEVQTPVIGAAAASLRIGDTRLPAPCQGRRAVRAVRQPPPAQRRRDRGRGAHLPRRGPRAVALAAQPGGPWPCSVLAATSRCSRSACILAALRRRPGRRRAPAERGGADDRRPDGRLAARRCRRSTRLLGAGRAPAFEQAFASFPLCCPSRATHLTGQYAHNHGVLHNAGPFGGYTALDHANTLPVWLQRAGYRTMHVGRYLNGYEFADGVPPGWNDWYGSPTRTPSTTATGR